ncbi:myosin heavy chain IB-like isoform X1 [Balaenoptera musculus]|uniref:Myosin heavy chain IB-like isoform X1 n=1 Tax=Balaenoptera musculus TaxID=9771 RepID=A0A8B8W170_BALMU|nr:myosin heavy chain IB-like isoform X1 [Balaenoptera musculus]XP_036690798.1 myosin heavy chain IB-like isoform X1 [Balaenoptera musculus]XP_036690800.1 myosin heavy chain IB-like isoform X1 [Balaenoptera musculus]XP_036690801.1 myosin heavy chain IB-like isoform X1 [Balaenoptera musculus]XP_036690802.1 myosin heavy chain IB-like isoform X1 [Balaenoptera musculus]XP_036690803.1 myosin heavy chain IB-like isoform X1 [Balaenoptera musculus]XP_036690804.1 myosin heavy chain IB-like isoform X1 
MHARGGRTGSAEGRAGGDAGQRRRGGRGPGGGGGERGPRGRACLSPAARSCVQYVCLGGRPRASVRRGPRGPAQLRDCRSRSAPARLVPAGSCARPSDVNGGNGGCRRGFGLSQAESAAGRGREGPRRGSTGGGGPRGGGWGGRALAGPGPPRPEPGEWAGAAGAGRVTSRRAAPPPVPRPVLSRAARRPDGSENAPRPPQPTLTPAASRDPKCQRPETCLRGWRRCGQAGTGSFTSASPGRAQGYERIILEAPLGNELWCHSGTPAVQQKNVPFLPSGVAPKATQQVLSSGVGLSHIHALLQLIPLKPPDLCLFC